MSLDVISYAAAKRAQATANNAVVKAPTKVGMIAATAPNSVAAVGALDLTQRTMIQRPFDCGRWRMVFRNKNLRQANAGTAPTTACTITGIWSGLPTRATSVSSGLRWVGGAASLTQRHGPLTVPTNGAEVRSAWIDGDPFLAGVDKVISWGLTASAGGTGVASGNSFQGVTRAGSANAGTADLGGAQTLGVGGLYLDVRIEYEFADNVRQLTIWGDSNSIGYNPSVPPGGFSGAGAGCLPHECWPMLAGAMGGFDVINLGVGSAMAAEFAGAYSALTDRIPADADPLAAIVSLGTNDLTSPLATFVPNVGAINTKLRALGVGPIFWTTLTSRCHPNGSYDGGSTIVGFKLTADAAAGQNQVTLDRPPATTIPLLIGNGMNIERWTVSSVDGNTATLASNLASAHYAGEPAAQANELNRRDYNNFLRQNPDGCAGVFDFEKLTEQDSSGLRMDPRFAASDWLHRQRSAQGALAGLIAASGAKPLFG